jgi:alpha-galactosidase
MVDRAGAWPDDLRKQGEAKRWIDIKAAGINHFTWILDIRERATGRDLYPRLRAEAQRALPDFHPLTRHLFEVYGLMPTGGDMHVGELIGYASEFVGLDGPDFGLLARRRMDFDRLLGGAVQGQADLSEWLSGHSNERVVDFIAALRGGGNGYELAANIPNRGCIPNLPEDAIVEVPAVVSGDGVYGLHVGPLPDGIAALCAQQIAVQELAVEASVTGDRQKALQALLLDPTVPGFAAASAVLADLLAAHAAHLPQFAN